MKKVLSLLLALMMCISSANIVLAEGQYSGGTGSETDPYLISTSEDLWNFAKTVNESNAYEGVYFKLANDIEIEYDETRSVWTPIGTGAYDTATKELLNDGTSSFKGIFDGDGHTISNVEISKYTEIDEEDDEDVRKEKISVRSRKGLFGYTYNATIMNLTVDGFVTGNELVGGIVGEAANGTYIKNCINLAQVQGESKVGGIVGGAGAGDVAHGRKVIDGCTNDGLIVARAYVYDDDSRKSVGVGGVAGYVDSVNAKIYQSKNTGSVYAGYSLGARPDEDWRDYTHFDGIGGIAGYVNAGTVEECENKGSVYGERRVGGVVGTLNKDGVVIKSGSDMRNEEVPENADEITDAVVSLGILNFDLYTGEGTTVLDMFEMNYSYQDKCLCMGGVVGINDGGTVTECYADYTVINGMQQVGGVVGRNNGKVEKCSSENSMIVGSSPDYTKDNGTEVAPYYTYTGGVVGYNTATINECTAKKVTIDSLYNAVGGICGYDKPETETLISNCKNIDCTITTDYTYEEMKGSSFNARIGGIVGEGNNVVNCSTEGEEGRVLGNAEVGGIVGRNNGTTKDSHNMGVVTGSAYIGGIVGANYDTVKNCYNERFFKGEGTYLGGVVGQNNGIVEECYNTGEIKTTEGLLEHAGGVVGINSKGAVLNKCYNEAAISGKNNIGGISGINSNGIVKNCYNEGAIFGQDKVGGIVGLNEWMSGSSDDAKDAYILNNFNKGAVDGGTDVSRVGGISGINQGYIDNCYNSGAVTYSADTQEGYRGLITGQNDVALAEYSKIMNSYSNTQDVPLAGNYNETEGVVDSATVSKVSKSQTSNVLKKLNDYVEQNSAYSLVEWGYKNGEAELLLNGEPSNIARVTLEQTEGANVSFVGTEENYVFVAKGEEVSVLVELEEGMKFSGFMYDGGFVALDKMTVAENVYTFNAPDEYDVILTPVLGDGVFITSAECTDSEGNVIDNALKINNISAIKVDIMTTNTDLEGDVIAAAYNKDGAATVLAIKNDCKLSSNEVEAVLENVTVPADTTEIKVFLWDSVESVKPICGIYKVSLEADYAMDGMMLYLDGLDAGTTEDDKWYNLVGEDYYTLNNVTRTDKGFSFNGTDSYAKSSEEVDMADSDRTIEISFANDTYNKSNSSYMFGMGIDDSSNLMIGRNKEGKMLVYATKSNLVDYVDADVKTVSVTVSGGMLKIYINGVFVGEIEVDVNTSVGNIILGNSSKVPTAERYWKGDINSVRIYDRELSAEEIEANYESDVRRFQ